MTEGERRVRRVLLVEDDPRLLELLAQGLEARGYAVTAASSVQEVLETIPGAPEPFDVLVTDIELGDGWGASLAAEVRQQQPGIKVVFMSGYLSEDPVLRPGIQEHMVFVEKPFTVAELSRVLDEVLSEPT